MTLLWYRGRNDDLIKSSGHRIGPAEIEDVLIAIPPLPRPPSWPA
jgi:acyl-coenzyme A synthetase/AMP-(fatty) acid ligase